MSAKLAGIWNITTHTANTFFLYFNVGYGFKFVIFLLDSFNANLGIPPSSGLTSREAI